MSVTVVGLDLSLTATGLASSDGWCALLGEAKVTTLALVERTLAIDRLAMEILKLTGEPDLAVVEAPAFSKSHGGSSERAALRHVVVRSLHHRGVPVVEVKPNVVKLYMTGKGSAGKGDMLEAVIRRLPHYATQGDDNLADAVALAAMGMDHLGVPMVKVPEQHRRALASVDWPRTRERVG